MTRRIDQFAIVGMLVTLGICTWRWSAGQGTAWLLCALLCAVSILLRWKWIRERNR